MQLSWLAVSMGKCAELTNVQAGGQVYPIRYQCTACPHLSSDPSFLPKGRVCADDVHRERETMLARPVRSEWSETRSASSK